MGKIIGMDLGTTNSCVAVMENGKAEVIANADGNRTTPSVVAYKDNKRLVGGLAKRQAIINSDTVSSIKRKMGTKEKVKLNNKNYTPEEVSAMILQNLKTTAEDYLGHKITEAVITVPAYFNDAQRTATKNAGKIAGLDVKRIINEPTAAALAYGINKSGKDMKILVYDLGGGTFDVSVLEVADKTFEVLATSGNNHLGGDDFDERLSKWILGEIKKQYSMDFSKDKKVLQMIREVAEKAKKDLSGRQQTEISLPFLTMKDNMPVHFEAKITRSEFEKLIYDLVQKTIPCLQQAMKDAKLNVKDLNEVLLVGGSTRIPLVQKLVKEQTKKEPSKSINPDEVVAAGAAIQGGVLAGDVKDVLLLDVTPLTLGIETMGNIATPIINRNTTIPVEKSQVFTTSEDNQPAVDIHIVQGERSCASDNKSLGRFTLDGIRSAPRGAPKIKVTFEMDADGILNVTAKDTDTNKEQNIVIKNSGHMTDSEIEIAVQDAEKYREQDEKFKQNASVINAAETLIHSIDVELDSDKMKVLPKASLENIRKIRDELRGCITANDIEGIKTKQSDLEKAIQDLRTEAETFVKDKNESENEKVADEVEEVGDKEAKVKEDDVKTKTDTKADKLKTKKTKKTK